MNFSIVVKLKMDWEKLENFVNEADRETLIELFSKIAARLDPDLDAQRQKEADQENPVSFIDEENRPLYAERNKRDYESPLVFLTVHYSDLLGHVDLSKMLTRPRLLQMDRQLCVALDNWGRNNAERQNEIKASGLITKEQFNDLRIARRIAETGKPVRHDFTDVESIRLARLLSNRRTQRKRRTPNRTIKFP